MSLTKRVAVALVPGSPGERFLSWNIHWKGYTFPMKRAPAGRDDVDRVAIEGLEYDVSQRLPSATATYLGYVQAVGRSGSTGEMSRYDYLLFEVDPGEPLKLEDAMVPPGHPVRFASLASLAARADELTWSTDVLLKEASGGSRAVMVVLTRTRHGATEHLVVHNELNGGYLLPTAVATDAIAPYQIAAGLVRAELGYAGPMSFESLGEVPGLSIERPIGGTATVTAQVYRAVAAGVTASHSEILFEDALRRSGRLCQWATARQIEQGDIPLSPAMRAVSPIALSACVASAAPRVSEGGLAYIERSGAEPAWLAQWNENWQAYAFVGGHRHADESFRECVIREVGEELGLASNQFEVDDQPMPLDPPEYDAVSRSAGVLTRYRMELYRTRIAPNGMQSLWGQSSPAPSTGEDDDEPPLNRWITEPEVRRLQTTDGDPVSPTIFTLLAHAGVLIT